MFKWLRRDRRLALIFVVDVVLVALVIVALIVLVWPRSSGSTANSPAAGVESRPTAAGTAVLTFAPDSPAPPTVNPTRLVALPNQGQNAAPPPPPGLAGQGTAVAGNNNQPTPLTPTPDRSR